MHYQKFLFSLVPALFLLLTLSSCNQTEEDPEKTTDPTQSQVQQGDKPATAQKGDRTLGLAVNETASVTFDSAYNQAIEIGPQIMTLPLSWDVVETKPKHYANPLPAIANEFYPTNNLSLSLELNPVDTNHLRVPKDLKKSKFSSPVVLKRYIKTLDWCLSQLKNTDIKCIVVGNEVDGYLTTPDKWNEYISFFKTVKAHCNKVKPGVPVGAKIMVNAILTEGNNSALELANLSDVAMLTYYPIKDDFTVKPPESINNTFDALTRTFNDKKIYMLELGYPSSAKNKSTPAKQAIFVKNAFKAWDKHQNTIKLVNFVWMNDVPALQLKEFGKYYKVKNDNFLHFLGSIGLCSENGTKKEGYDQLKTEANARGW